MPDSIFLVLEEDIKAYVDLRDHASEGIFKAPVIVQKTGTALGIDPLEIKVEPMEITVSLERKLTRNLEIIPTIEGNPAQGYEMTQTFLLPSSVTVEGPRSYVQDLTSIRTQPINISGKKSDFSVRKD